MAIIKELEIKMNNDRADFSEKLFFYQNDRGIDLHIKVVLPKVKIGYQNQSLLAQLENAYASAIILKPDKSVISRDRVSITNDIIVFTIDHELTDEMDETGFYTLQFHIYDNDDNRITIPPVSFEIKELIGTVIEPPKPPGNKAICGTVKCGEVKCGEGLEIKYDEDLGIKTESRLSRNFKERFGVNNGI